MRCLYPITLKNGQVVPCGTCLICKVNRRNSWNLRLRYEALAHKTSLFVGLSYDDDNIPRSPTGCPTLLFDHFTHFLEKVRYKIKKDGFPNFRYYGIGEYGATTYRPHYHLQFFTAYPLGYEDCMYAQDQSADYCNNICPEQCIVRHIRDSWPYGHATSYPCTPADIGYITLLHVNGLEPPYKDSEPAFIRQSSRPGIGSNFLDNKELVSRVYDKDNAVFTYTPDGTVTPLPRYYRDRIFTRAELEYIKPEIDDDSPAIVKSHTFANSWLTNSWKSEGKL